MAETIKRPWGIAVFVTAIVAPMALVTLAWTFTAAGHGDLPSAFVGAMATLCLVSIIGVILATVIRPAPRISHTPQGIEVRPALFVSVLTATMAVSMLLAMAVGALLYATGNLDVHFTDPDDRRFAGKMFVLALITPAILIVPYLPAIRSWLRGERKPWDSYPPVLVSPRGVQIDRLGVAKYMPWESIADIREEKEHAQRRLTISSIDPQVSIHTEKLPLLGGPWLVDTIRGYWQNPQERWRLAAGGSAN